jgi:hypothetical protein
VLAADAVMRSRNPPLKKAPKVFHTVGGKRPIDVLTIIVTDRYMKICCVAGCIVYNGRELQIK